MRPLMVALVCLVAGVALAAGCGGEKEPASPSPDGAGASSPAPRPVGTAGPGGTAPPITNESPEALLTQALENMNQLTGIRAKQSVTVSGQGISIAIEQEIFYEAPDKVYVATSLFGVTSEVFAQGQSIYVREGGGDWALSSPLALGIEPEDMFKTIDVTALASEIEIVGEVNEDGTRLVELIARLDPDAYHDEISDLFLAGSELFQGSGRLEKVEVRYFVDAERVVVRKGSADLDVVADGVEVHATNAFVYEAVNAPVEFPTNLPGPGSSGQAGGAPETLDAGRGCGIAEERTARLMALLSHVPARPDTVSSIYYDDYECARTFLDVPLPAEEASPAELLAYRNALLDGARVFAETGHVAGFSSFFQPDAWDGEVGFNVNNVDQHINAGHPPKQLEVLRGHFDPARIEMAVTSGPASSQGLETVQFSSEIAYYKWGEDYQQDLRNRTPFRPLGKAGRLVPGTEFLLWAHGSADIESMIASSIDGLPSLADVPEFEAAAVAIGEIGGYSAVISASSNSLSANDLNDLVTGEYGREAIDALRASDILRPYLLLAAGIGQDSTGLYSILVYVNPDVNSAQANAEILRSILEVGVSLHYGDAWSNHVDRSEVGVIGSVTYAKLWSSNPTLGLASYNNLDSQVLSE